MPDGTDHGGNRVTRYRLVFGLLLTVVALFRLWFATTLPLSGDEAYHWEWSRNLAFGYYDHPGLTAYLIRLFTWVFGCSTEFTVRLPALVMLTVTSIVCYLLARTVVRNRGGAMVEAERAGFMAGLLIVFIPIFAVFAGYISTDPPLICFWTLALYLFYLSFTTGRWSAWIGAGIALGLAMMSKFLAFLLVPGLLLFALTHKESRIWFRRPHAYVAGICALLTFSPFLWWNATHGWATFVFNFVSRQEDNAFEPWRAAEFVLGQALALSPGVFVFAVVCLWLSLREYTRKRDMSLLFLGMSSLAPVVYFLCVSFRREVGIHWPAAGWIGSIVLVSCCLSESASVSPPTARWRWGKAALALCIGMTVLIHLLVHVPSRWIEAANWRYPGDPDRINTEAANERYGWRELGQRVERMATEMKKEDGKDVFVISGQYGLSAGIAFYAPGQMRMHLWSRRRVHGENYRFWDNFGSLKGQNAIYVAKDQDQIVDAIFTLEDHFADVRPPEQLPILVDGRQVRSFFLLRCCNFDGIEPEFPRD
jgi:dolichol-phosphate mannosyltransferase